MVNLTKPTHNIMSNIMDNSKQPQPEVGMGATELCYTDRHAYTIVEVCNPKTIVVQQDKSIRTDNNGMSDSQSYRYEADPQGNKHALTLRKNGRWVKRGESMRDGRTFVIGLRSEYYDYSF
jgi:hypothetical protein